MTSNAANERNIIDFDEGWSFMENGLAKIKRILGGSQESFSSEECIMYCSNVYNMCTQDRPDHSRRLYTKYGEVIAEYNTSTVLPSLTSKHDEFMLRELTKRWENHKVMVGWLSSFFYHLDRFCRGFPPVKEVGLNCFRELVYDELKDKVKDAVITLIDKERNGELIDRALLKNVVSIFVEIDETEDKRYYVNDFETHMINNTGAYYSRKAANWILEDSCPDYMLRCDELLKKEKERVSHYLHSSTEQKLLEKVQHELFVVYKDQLLDSGCRVLFRDEKMNDLSRMYRLYNNIPTALERVATVFKRHTTTSGLAIVQSNGVEQEGLIRNIIDWHEKYMGYVTNCFSDHILFHNALEMAVHDVCSKSVGGISSAEILATFCDNILRGGEDIEETLEKVVRLLNNFADKDLFVEFCRKKLAWHLLIDQTSNDHERNILLMKLEQLCGGKFITDLTLAKEKVKIPLSAADERREVIENVTQKRKSAIDNGIVRIMRTRRVLGYRQLVSECSTSKHLNNMFKPDITLIDGRIEDLIHRKFMERDVENPSIFRYLA